MFSVLLALALACKPEPEASDLDGDGVAAPDDCDDADATVFPGNAETCNEQDDDCDGDVDEEAADAESGFRDIDGDGFGDPGSPITACDLPDDAVEDSTDCDDTDEGVNPDAHERCNGVDDDCDEGVDDDAVDAERWYEDQDRDGWGNANTVRACEAPEGFVDVGGDCQDVDGSIHPGATDVPYDGIDADCGGDSDYDADGDGHDTDDFGGDDCDDDDPDAYAGATEVWYDGVDQDCAGDDDFDADADGYDVDTDCEDTRADAHPGLTEICGDGVDNDCDASTGPECRRTGTEELESLRSDAAVYGDDYSNCGTGLADAGDVDGDGYDDAWVVSKRGDTSTGSAYGAVFLLAGGPRWSTEDPIASISSHQLDGESGGNGLDRVAASGDFDGDGHTDVLVAAEDWDGGSASLSEMGRVYALSGPITATRGVIGGAATITGSGSGVLLGSDIAFVPDWNGDGNDEILVGSSGEDASAGDGGAAYVFEGPPSGALSKSDADFALYGDEMWSRFGTAVAAGDIDGDGLGDVLVGGPDYNGNRGAVLVFLGAATGTVAVADADHSWSEAGYAGVGTDVSVGGDVDGDGNEDVLLSAPAGSYGKVWLVAGGSLPSDLSGAAATIAPSVDGDAGSFGQAVHSDGDFDGDGLADVVIAAPNYQTASTDVHGAVYLFHGALAGNIDSASADVVLYGPEDDGKLGRALAFVDLDADGHDDLLAGAPWSSAWAVTGIYLGAVGILWGDGI